jgi:hypothetical protein
MKIVPLKEHLSSLLGSDKIDDALDILLNWAETHNDRDLNNGIIMQKAAFTSLQNDKRDFQITDENARMYAARIRRSVQSYIDDLPDDATIEIEEKIFQPISNPTNTPSVTPPVENEKLKILMLTANPAGTTKMNLDKEHSKIAEKLQDKQDIFNLTVKKAVNRTEFKELTEMAKPSILHFSGHGAKDAHAVRAQNQDPNTRDIGRIPIDLGGIIVQNEDKSGYEVLDTRKIDALFEYFKDEFSLKAVILNACYSEEQAKVIAKYVPYVIGTTKAIVDDHAIAFSVGFYFKLVESQLDFERSYKSGRTEAKLAGASQNDFIIYKNGEILTL